MDSKIVAIFILITCLIFTSTPVINSIQPDMGINNQIINVTIDGGKFNSGSTVKLTKLGEPDIIADNVRLISKKQLTCSFDLDNRAVGQWNVVVTNSNKFNKRGKTATLADSFNIQYPAPIINSISPNEGVIPDETTFELAGSNFRVGAEVRLLNSLKELNAKNITVASPQKITGIIYLNNAQPGIYNVEVINDDQKVNSLPNGFTVKASIPVKTEIKISSADNTTEPISNLNPTISEIVPDQGFNNGAVLCTIWGSNFQTGLLVKLISPDTEIPGQNIKISADQKIVCFFDLNQKPVGYYDVIVINPDGQQALLTSGFKIIEYTPSHDDLNEKLTPTFFDFDKAEIRTDQVANMEENFNLLNENPELYILIGGHADERGSSEYNLDLSARRAEIIKEFLAQRGINPERITIYAYGKDYPAKKGHDETSWWFNRRVDIFVYETPPSKDQGLMRIQDNLLLR